MNPISFIREKFYIILPIFVAVIFGGIILFYYLETQKIKQTTLQSKPQIETTVTPRPTPQLPLNFTVATISGTRVELISSTGENEIITDPAQIKVFKGVPPQAFPGKISDLKPGQQLIGKIATDSALWVYIPRQ